MAQPLPPDGYTYDVYGQLVPLNPYAPWGTLGGYSPGHLTVDAPAPPPQFPAPGSDPNADPNRQLPPVPPPPQSTNPGYPEGVPYPPDYRFGVNPGPGGGRIGGAPTITPTPTTPPPKTGPTTFGVPGNGNAPTPFNWPTFTAPPFVPATGPTAPPPFSHPDFVAPTLDEAKNQPGYQFGLQQGQGALQNSAAARGTLRGGGTLKDLFDYTNAAAEQNYGNVYAQNATTYNTNLAKDVGTYATNWGVTKDVSTLGNAANQQNYQDSFQNAGAEFNPKFQAAQLSFSDMYARWLANLNAQLHIFDQGGV